MKNHEINNNIIVILYQYYKNKKNIINNSQLIQKFDDIDNLKNAIEKEDRRGN